ncbi:unnamed protein product [Closterium sp. NIES-65]|nr:unnamed protein product [Closterium sp. NIES-65]
MCSSLVRMVLAARVYQESCTSSHPVDAKGLFNYFLMNKKNTIRFCELNINGLGSAGKQGKCKDWIRNKADIAVLTNTRIPADHNFWTQLKPSAVVAGGQLGRQEEWQCVLVMGDLNVVEDPALDKSPGVGSSAENRRLMGYWAATLLFDVFRFTHPGKKEYTSHMRAKGVSTRTHRALATQPLLGKMVEVRHADITNKMTDHWCAVVVALESSAAVDRGPGIWRLRAAQAKKKGIRNRVERVLKDAGGDLGKMLPRLTACLRAYTREEKKRVGATKRHMEKEVKIYRQRLSRSPNCKRTGTILLKKEELLDAYEKNHQEKLQEWLGVKAELVGETTTGFLSRKAKMRKAQTEMSAVNFKGVTHSGAREVLVAATEFFKDSFGGRGEAGSSALEPRVMCRTLCDGSRNALSAPWSEEEVRTAVRELASGKSPRQDGLPKELFEHNWDLLGPLADAVAVVADAIEAGATGREDWFLLMVDFHKAFDSISRPFLFRTLREMGVPEIFVSWAEGLHTGAGTRLHINGWTGDRVAVERGVRQGCPLAPYLFLCAVELLCQEFARRGLGIGDGGADRLAYLGYADDTSLLLNGEEQLADVAEALENFGEEAGLKVNKVKTVVFPLGVNRGKSPLAGLQYKWADKDAPEWLLGIWITPNGDSLLSWEKALERARKELAKWEIQHLTTTARVTIINGYISPIFMFQAYIYPPPEEIWTKIKRICHNFVSGGEATEEKAFILWKYELICTPREEGGLGMICPKKQIASIAVQNVGRMMLQANSIKKWLTERAAAMPLGPDMIYAHQSLLKHWTEGSKRWKGVVQSFWKSPFCVTPEPENRWEVEREQLAFNRRIPS